MESRKNNDVKSKRRCFSQTSHLLPHPVEAELMSVSEVAEGVSDTGSGQAHSASASESMLSEESLPYLSSSLDTYLEMYNKNRERICCAQADESKKEADVLGEACDDPHLNWEVCGDVRQSYLSEDSQLEYLSAHEQDFNDGDSSSEFSEQREAVGTKTLKQINPVQEVPEGGVTKEQNILEVSEDSSPSSRCDVGVCTYTEAATPKPFHLLQEHSDMICGCQEKKTEYHSALCGGTLESHSCGNKKRVCPNLLASDSSENSEADSTQPPLTAAGAVAEHNDRHVRSTSVRRDNPSHHKNLKNKAGDSTIDQAVDVSSDFRACFTTSRSISAQVCLLSSAINTELTTTNKSQPVEWLCEACAGYACSADWPQEAENTEEIQSQLSDILEEHSDTNAATAPTSSYAEEQHEWCGSSLEISTDRLVQPDKQAVKDSPTCCCQLTLQRAVEAELQLLNTHYKMCYQHCWKIYKLALKENICFHRCNGSAELESSLILALEELKENYSSMRMKIRMGTPLNALPPLSVEIELFPIYSSYVPREVLRQDICYDSVSGMRKTYFKAPEGNERNISVNIAHPQTVCFTVGHQPSDSFSSKTSVEQHEDHNVECGCVKIEEWNEDLTVADSSVKPEETKKQQEKQDRVDVREAKITESGNECSFIRVGGLSSSVSEADLRSHFQKYQIADILICMASGNYRYAFLCFKEMNQAQLAVEEMNQKEIKGKAVSVELVNDSSENKSLVSQILKAKLQHEIQPVDNSQINDQDKAFASTSSAAKAPDATSASEKAHLYPLTSSAISSTQVPSETKCPGLKSPTKDSFQNTGEDLQQKIPSPFSTSSYDAFVSPNAPNSSSFTKLMNKLKEIYPTASSDKIVAALLEVQKNNKGVLSGLSINSIVERTSAILKKSEPLLWVVEEM